MAKKVGKKMGLGVVAAAAAAAGYYFYASKEAAKNRKIAAKWAIDMKKDVLRRVKESGVMDSAAVKKAVAEAQKAVKQVKEIDAKDVVKAANELKENWDAIAKEAQKSFAKGKKAAAKAVTTAVKKVK